MMLCKECNFDDPNLGYYDNEKVCYQCRCKEPAIRAALDLLQKEFKQPVMPINNYCRALTQWATAIAQANLEAEKTNQDVQGSDYYKELNRILIDINKSALLNRLLYCGGKFRTKKCPTHQGKLNMQEWIGNPYQPTCEHQCDGTGWLREPGDPICDRPPVCNKPHSSPRGTEYCRQNWGHSGECSAWFKVKSS